MNPIKTALTAISEVYATKRYILWTIVVAVFFFALSAFIRNYRLIIKDFSGVLLLSLVWGTFTSLALVSVLNLTLISLLTGIIVVLSAYLLQRQKSIGVVAGTPGVIMALLAPACPSCALGLLGVLGIGGFIGILPFKGLELGIAALILLVASILYLSNKIMETTCTLPGKAGTKKK